MYFFAVMLRYGSLNIRAVISTCGKQLHTFRPSCSQINLAVRFWFYSRILRYFLVKIKLSHLTWIPHHMH